MFDFFEWAKTSKHTFNFTYLLPFLLEHVSEESHPLRSLVGFSLCDSQFDLVKPEVLVLFFVKYGQLRNQIFMLDFT